MKANSRRRVLISSVAMLLVALVALGTSTFAWFTNTTTAKADNAKITVAAPSGLKIAAVEAGTAAPELTAYSSTIDLTSLAQGSFNPASGNVTDANGISFFEATVDGEKNVSAISTSSNRIAIDIYGILTASNLVDGVETAKAVNLTGITQGTKTGSAGEVVRCAYYNGTEKKAYINFGDSSRNVNPLIATGADLKSVKADDNFVIPYDATNTATYVAQTAISAASYTTVSNVSVPAVKFVEDKGDAVKIGTIYFWVEGQDILCNNANAQSVVGSTGNISFNYALVD